MANDILIPPDLDPVSPENVALVDDATQVFAPTLARGNTQRISFGDPRWRIKRRYSGVRAQDKARLMTVFNEARGKFCTIRTTPGYVQRGSFPSQEVLPNGVFANGDTGWTCENGFGLTVKDQVMRAKRLNATGAYAFLISPTVNVSQYATYAVRYFLDPGPAYDPSNTTIRIDDYGVFTPPNMNFEPLATQVIAPRGSTMRSSCILISPTTGATAVRGQGTFFDVPYVSIARCPLVDTQVNLITYSDQISDASWTKARCLVTSNTVVAPDGNVSGDTLTEDTTAAATHFIQTSGLAVSGATNVEICATAIVKANTRTWCVVTILENTGSTQANAYFNLSTGTVGTIQNNGNMVDARASVASLGNGWYRCSIVCHKTNGATSVQAQVYLAQGDGLALYDGNGVNSIYVWRVGVAVAPTFSIPQFTSGVASAGNSYQGGMVNAKGFPTLTDGNLLAGDFIEINGELKIVTASVNSDANGNATIQFRPAMVTPPADNDPIIICNPMGRFLLTDVSWDAQWGLQLDVTATLDEVYEP